MQREIMMIGIVISTSEAEVVWNAFRFGVTALKANHEVKTFLMNKGVEALDVRDEKDNIKEQVEQFLEAKGHIFACGTCLKAREEARSNLCSISTMKDLLNLVEESEKILTFG